MNALTMNQVAKVLAMSALFVSTLVQAGTKDGGAIEYQPIGTVLCKQEGVVDASYRIFIQDIEKAGATPVVTLSVPRGETSVTNHKTLCPSMPGAVETALRCELTTSEGETFEILVASPGDSSLNARVTRKSKGGVERGVWLTCKRGFHNPIGGN